MLKNFYQNSFTLIELLLVVGILALMAGMSMPALRTYQASFEVNSLGRDLAVDLRYAQQKSVTEQVNHAVVFDDADTYSIVKKGTPDEIIETKNLSSGIDFYEVNFSGDYAEFNSCGAAKESGNVVIKDNTGKTLTIEVRPSGFIRVID